MLHFKVEPRPSAVLPDGPPGFVKELSGHTGGVRSVQMLPDGRRVLSYAVGNEVILWDVETGKPLWKKQLLDVEGSIGVMALLSGAGKAVTLHSASEHVLTFQDLETGAVARRATLPKREGQYAVAGSASPDGRRFMLVFFSAKAGDVLPVVFQLWDADSKEPLGEWNAGPGVALSTVAWLDDHRVLAGFALGGDKGRTQALVDVNVPGTVRKTGAPQANVGFFFVPVSGKPDQILAHHNRDELALFDLGKDSLLRQFPTPAVQRQLAFLDDHRVLGLGESWGDALRLWDITTGKLLWQQADERLCDQMVVSPDGRYAVTNGTVEKSPGQRTPGDKLLVWRLPAVESVLSAATFAGHRYQFVRSKASWSEAKAKAEALGGHLATITSAEEHAWFMQTIAPLSKHVWLGGRRQAEDGSWAWLTGEPWKFTAWARHADGTMEPAKPSPGTPLENILEFGYYPPTFAAPGWNDEQDRARTHPDAGYLVEWDTLAK